MRKLNRGAQRPITS